MTIFPSRLSALALLSIAALPVVSAQNLESARSDAKGRHLAPRDTFYLLTYVAVKTDKGVEGFDPGQQVKLVEVRRETQTLVVTDGHAQVEVSPSKLTNDMDVAAMVRQKDQTKQAQIAAYVQTEQEAYNKYQREAADATAKDLEHTRQVQQQQAAELRREEQRPVAQTAEPVNSSANVGGYGYYGDGGYGYGNPYSYFVNGTTQTTVAPASNAAAQGSAQGGAASTGNAAARSTTGGNTAPAGNPAASGTAGRPPR